MNELDRSLLLGEMQASLRGRPRPEEVCKQIVHLLADELSESERRMLKRASRGSNYYSLMETAFQPVVGLEISVSALAEKLGTEAPDGQDVAGIRRLLERARAELGIGGAGKLDFKESRLDRSERHQAGITMSRRRYDKLFRLCARLEELLPQLERQQQLFNLGRVAKTSWAAEIPAEVFSKDAWTASFCAYMAANLGRRSLFTSGPQARAFDEVAEMLFQRLEASPTTSWFAVAHVFPRADVLERLGDREKMELLNKVLATLELTSRLLKEAWERSDLHLDTMVVDRGNDSSTWNSVAGAWNRARDYWIALLESMGCGHALDEYMPGKVLRLMAADVAWWHSSEGGDVHDDTAVWRELPRPWEVFEGTKQCTREMVESACRKHGIDPTRSGWSRARARTAIESWRPTPELVHGVTVNHPELALWMRKVGVFSGKSLKPEALLGL